jgi:hypothetical protein
MEDDIWAPIMTINNDGKVNGGHPIGGRIERTFDSIPSMYSTSSFI